MTIRQKGNKEYATEYTLTQTETGKHFKLPPAELKNIAGGVLFKGEGRIIISDKIDP